MQNNSAAASRDKTSDQQEDSMDELIKLVTSKAGISEAQAKDAIETVLGFLKDKLPAPVAGQVEAVLKGDLGAAAGALGGLFGKK
jgi:uncharacterized protein (DUF2267 family)